MNSLTWPWRIIKNTWTKNNTNIVSSNSALYVVTVRAGSAMRVSGMECERVPSRLWHRLWGTAGPLVWDCWFISAPLHMTNKASKRLHVKVKKTTKSYWMKDSYKKIRWIRRNQNTESMYILLFLRWCYLTFYQLTYLKLNMDTQIWTSNEVK